MNGSEMGRLIDPWLSVADSQQKPVIDENDMKFSDNFEPQLANPPKASSEELIGQSLDSLPDSQQYIRSLGMSLESLNIFDKIRLIFKSKSNF